MFGRLLTRNQHIIINNNNCFIENIKRSSSCCLFNSSSGSSGSHNNINNNNIQKRYYFKYNNNSNRHQSMTLDRNISNKTLVIDDNVNILDDKDIAHYKEFGYVVKRNLFGNDADQSLMTEHQMEIRRYLAKQAGIHFDESLKIGSFEESQLLKLQEDKMSKVSTGFGGMVNFYHGQAMYKIREHPSLYKSFEQLYDATYSHSDANSKQWPNDYQHFDPKHISSNETKENNDDSSNGNEAEQLLLRNQPTVQKGTGTHLDCNPFHLFRGERISKESNTVELIPLRFWQPIQAFVALSDTVEPGNGGFCETDPELVKQLQHIPMQRGDVIFWDWRIPHCNDEVHSGTAVREVVYSAHLPAVPLNDRYALEQLNWYHKGVHPTYTSKQFATLESIDYQLPTLTPLGKQLMNIDKWSLDLQQQQQQPSSSTSIENKTQTQIDHLCIGPHSADFVCQVKSFVNGIGVAYYIYHVSLPESVILMLSVHFLVIVFKSIK
ncbi:hypothetical protein PPL_00691 [Heterostelium album PN500]|uniref:Phytanoyl-CoA dioxygenase n=1 Tax=Heterostelium pallidum (strain ATCC 26659 / Pp 5 / PN500) TaxID=670386 RepID=D3AX62_HETP5|nr:hypothetical protein PPL_00691 [Heterostelium album PN500]EFA86131.1 hypothetical protein PPL_00691 [Heterostelium album PN500]|eukprot:XP_020438236.1 hypothetical protein PPL_00691 [Heterostelium album PN500]